MCLLMDLTKRIFQQKHGFDVLLTVHLRIILIKLTSLMHKFLFYNKFIISFYTFWAQQCSKHVEEYNKLIIKREFMH